MFRSRLSAGAPRVILATMLALASLSIDAAGGVAQQMPCTAADQVLPTGQVSPSPDNDPQIPLYCVSAPVQAPTRVTHANDWVDNFGTSGYARFQDGDMGYRVFDTLGGVTRTAHLINGDHWIDDNRVQFGGGAMLRPDRTFSFENGRLVVEGDVAAGKQVYGGNQWVEFVVSTAAQPDLRPPDAAEQEYAYGRFKGSPTFGCRFQNGGENTCAGFTGSSLSFPPTEDKPPCFSLSPDRLWELSYFQDCGDNFGGTHFGGFSDPQHSVWRSCDASQNYDDCLDRFRIELSKTGLVIYVNGIRYFEDSGWDSRHQLPDGLVNAPVYVYFADWGTVSPDTVYRFHWGRLAVNPHDGNGNILPPSPSPTFSGGPTPPPTPPPPTTPPATAGVQALAQPQRLVDTRVAGGAIGSGQSRCFAIANQGGIPSDAAGVVLNVTAVGYRTPGWLSVYPSGQAVPATSTLNFDPSEYAVANGALVGLGAGGQACVAVGTIGGLPGDANVVLDATGYVPASATAQLPLLTSPTRLADTRTLGGPIAAGQSRCFAVAGMPGIAPDAVGVVLNVTAVGSGAPGWLSVYPSGQSVPATSTVNFSPAAYAVANNTVMALGPGGKVCVSVGTINAAPGSANVVLDATGYLTPAGQAAVPLLSTPQRLVDTRGSGGAIAAGQSRCFAVAGHAGVPSNATSVALNVTAVGYGAPGWLTLYPSDQGVPTTSSLNFDTSEYAMANGSMVRLGSDGSVCVAVGTVNSVPGGAQVVLDVSGYQVPASSSSVRRR